MYIALVVIIIIIKIKIINNMLHPAKGVYGTLGIALCI